MCILLIEDDHTIRSLIVDALYLFDPTITVIALGRSLDPGELECRNVDCVILDLMLVGPQNGVEIARELRATSGSTPRIIALSASTLELENAKRDGIFDDYIAKPFDISILLAAVHV